MPKNSTLNPSKAVLDNSVSVSNVVMGAVDRILSKMEQRSSAHHLRQVIVVDKSLNMPLGKMLAQVAHAGKKLLIENLVPRKKESPWEKALKFISGRKEPTSLEIKEVPFLREWLEGSYATICVLVRSPEELMEVYERAKAAKLPCAMVVDEGRTVFNGVQTKTCCAIGPAPKELLDPVTGHLKLL